MLILLLFLSSIEEDIKNADYYYEYRHKDPEYLSKSKEILKNILAKEPDNEEALWRMARTCYQYGDNAKTKKDKLSWYDKGKEYAQKLIKVNSSHPEGHFWYAVNLGRIGQTRGILKSLSLAPTIKREFEKTLKLDPKHIGAMDGLAVYYYELPAIFGGNLNKSIKYLKKAISIDPNYSLLYIDLAKVYIKKKDYKSARKYLNKVFEIKNPTHPADYYLDDKPEAKRLLEKIKEK